MPKLIVLLRHGHAAHIQSDDPYKLARHLLKRAGTSSAVRNFTGADGSDIYFRPDDVIAVEIPAHS